MSAIATATDLDEGVAGFTDGNLTVLVTVEWADVTSFAQDGGFRGEALRHAARPILQSKGQILGVLWKTCTTRERERGKTSKQTENRVNGSEQGKGG